jgi:hypothetical protein
MPQGVYKSKFNLALWHYIISISPGYMWELSLYSHMQGRIQGGAHPARAPPLKLEKIRFFGVKSWFFTRNTPNISAPPSAWRNFLSAPPNLKSWIRPWYGNDLHDRIISLRGEVWVQQTSWSQPLFNEEKSFCLFVRFDIRVWNCSDSVELFWQCGIVLTVWNLVYHFIIYNVYTSYLYIWGLVCLRLYYYHSVDISAGGPLVPEGIK